MHAFLTVTALLVGSGEASPDLTRQEMRLPSPSEWVLEWMEENGKPHARVSELTLDRKGAGTLRLRGRTLRVTVHDLDPHPHPARLDLTIEGREYPGIYRSDDARLVLSLDCLPHVREGRPTDFTTRPGDGRCLFVFKRKR
jgi:hypothetical protein